MQLCTCPKNWVALALPLWGCVPQEGGLDHSSCAANVRNPMALSMGNPLKEHFARQSRSPGRHSCDQQRLFGPLLPQVDTNAEDCKKNYDQWWVSQIKTWNINIAYLTLPGSDFLGLMLARAPITGHDCSCRPSAASLISAAAIAIMSRHESLARLRFLSLKNIHDPLPALHVFSDFTFSHP